MACPHCGSWAVKADRALAGRMVCARCGQPLGLGAVPRRGRRWGGRLSLPRPPRLGLGLGLGVLVLISAGLAALEDFRPGTAPLPEAPMPDWGRPPAGRP
ncbi:MAG: hypothetical protein VKK62_09550 [Synechococcaceae cyanobacterium]|nr:hypothetical protein [Synechococcaceae cyanobacterium]